MTELMKRDDFARHLNTRFLVRLEGEPTRELELIEAKQTILNEWQDEFSLLFRSADANAFDQGTYRVTHEGLGELDIFLVPIKRDKDGIIYQAVYNLLPGLQQDEQHGS
jgi:hypothetical protein